MHSPSVPVTHPPFTFVLLHSVIGTHYYPSVVQLIDANLHSASVFHLRL